MKKFLMIIGAVVLIGIISGCGSDNDNPDPTPVAYPWSFTVTGGDGTAQDNGDGSYLVTYYDVDSELSVLAGDPEGELGVSDMGSLMTGWSQVAQESNNTGILEYTLGDGSTKYVMVRMDNPIYNETTGNFQFTAIPMEETSAFSTVASSGDSLLAVASSSQGTIDSSLQMPSFMSQSGIGSNLVGIAVRQL